MCGRAFQNMCRLCCVRTDAREPHAQHVRMRCASQNNTVIEQHRQTNEQQMTPPLEPITSVQQLHTYAVLHESGVARAINSGASSSESTDESAEGCCLTACLIASTMCGGVGTGADGSTSCTCSMLAGMIARSSARLPLKTVCIETVCKWRTVNAKVPFGLRPRGHVRGVRTVRAREYVAVCQQCRQVYPPTAVRSTANTTNEHSLSGYF